MRKRSDTEESAVCVSAKIQSSPKAKQALFLTRWTGYTSLTGKKTGTRLEGHGQEKAWNRLA